jgi:hypothetical protein
MLKKLKKYGQGPTKGCRAIDREGKSNISREEQIVRFLTPIYED